jgi:hypothetical protein
MDALWQAPLAGQRKRASSYDHSGGNADYYLLQPGERRTLLAHEGASGCIQRIWFTLGRGDPLYLQRVKIACVFDGQTTVADVPIGMFVATGPWRFNDLTSAAINVMRSRQMNRDQEGVGCGSVNLYWPMPFLRSARIELYNGCAEPLTIHYHIDYVEQALPAEPLLFHAGYRCVSPTTPMTSTAARTDPDLGAVAAQGAINLTNAHNYLLAEIAGRGRYVGTVLAVESHPDRAGKWYEGDDMFFIDGESWPPALHGTGAEDYFGMAWGVHRPYQAFDHGVTHYERQITDHDRFYDGRFTLYRWHLADPIQFYRSLHASIEAGHANDCAQHYESVAFWYSTSADGAG